LLEVVPLVKIEGSLDEIRELVGDVKRTAKQVRSTGRKVVKGAKKVKRKLSKWQKYIANKRNQIKFKSGPRKGRLDLKRMAAAFKRKRR
jgi:hypothetical protein